MQFGQYFNIQEEINRHHSFVPIRPPCFLFYILSLHKRDGQQRVRRFSPLELLIFIWHFVVVIDMCLGIRPPRHCTLSLINREVFVCVCACVSQEMSSHARSLGKGASSFNEAMQSKSTSKCARVCRLY